jgi:hypothetical protein
MERIRPIEVTDQRRLGSTNDGGYVIPKLAIELSTNLVTFGYGHNADFEFDFLKLKNNGKVIIVESSINFGTTMKNFLGSLLRFGRDPRAFPVFYLKCFVKYLRIRTAPKISYFNKEVVGNFLNLLDSQISWSSLIDDETDILKIDIEGAEYEILKEFSESRYLSTPHSIIVEFHEISKHLNLFNEILDSFSKYFYISNVHINNFAMPKKGIPDVIEITFLIKSLVDGDVKYASFIPSSLDTPCNPLVPEITYIY